jgi:putative phosphoribosyl transferase
MIFRDRVAAGRLLARKLERYRADRPIILGVTRGGVPVALEVARHLEAELDIIVVRKIGAPGQPEFAIGAVAEGGTMYLNREALRDLDIGDDAVAALADREAVKLARRVRAYRGDRPMPELAGRTVIIVDDGVATGATAHAAGRTARDRGASRVVLAVPVMAAAWEPELRPDFDDIVAVEVPTFFFAVGAWYENFHPVSDEAVLTCLRRAHGQRTGESVGVDAGPPLEPAPAGRGDPEEETVTISLEGSRFGPGTLDADLVVPAHASGLVMFIHGSGSTRRSSRSRFVAQAMQRAGFATLLFDLLTSDEAAEDEVRGRLRFDVELLTDRVLAATRWLCDLQRTRALRIGYFGASTGAAAALAAAAVLPERIAAVVSRGGRPDLVAAGTLEKVRAPVLLVIGGRDETVLRLNRAVLPHLATAELVVVPRATHLFEEPGALGAVAGLAARWFGRHLAEPGAVVPPSPA